MKYLSIQKKHQGTGSRTDKGFTIVEMMVSIAIFTIVALVAVGAMLKIVAANRKSQSLKTAVNNIDFALESMSRELRTATNYDCDTGNFVQAGNSALHAPRSCAATNSWTLAFYSSKTASKSGGGTCNLVHAYRFANNTIEKAEQQACTDTINTNSFASIISADITFSTTTINVQTSDVANIQPIVFFHFAGYTGVKERDKTYFDIQTSVSQRVSD
jgi:prepilin-type N-terminal cleavage/methylation domain-containing protein